MSPSTTSFTGSVLSEPVVYQRNKWYLVANAGCTVGAADAIGAANAGCTIIAKEEICAISAANAGFAIRDAIYAIVAEKTDSKSAQQMQVTQLVIAICMMIL